MEFTWRDNDNSAKEADLGVGQVKLVHPLGQLKDRVHQELGVAGRHGVDGLLANDVAVQANQTLDGKQRNV